MQLGSSFILSSSLAHESFTSNPYNNNIQLMSFSHSLNTSRAGVGEFKENERTNEIKKKKKHKETYLAFILQSLLTLMLLLLLLLLLLHTAATQMRIKLNDISFRYNMKHIL